MWCVKNCLTKLIHDSYNVRKTARNSEYGRGIANRDRGDIR